MQVLKCLTFVLINTCVMSAITWQDMRDVTLEVSIKYHATCVFILHIDSESVEKVEGSDRELWNYLASHYISTSYVKMNTEVDTASRCHSLYVLCVNHFILGEAAKELQMKISLSTGRWLLFLNHSEVSLNEFFAQIHIPYDCEFFVAHMQSGSLVISSVYHVYRNGTLQIVKVATRTLAAHLDWNPAYEKENSLHNAVVRAAVTPLENFMTIRKYEGDKAVELESYLIDVWNILQNRLNFSTEYLVSYEFEYETREDGEWTGVIGLVAKGQADVGLDEFYYMKERMDVVKYLIPLSQDRLTVFIRKPRMASGKLSSILSPFRHELWWTILGTGILLSLILNIMAPRERGFISSCFLVFSSFCLKASSAPQQWSSRLVYVTSCITAAVLYIAYSTTLISYLNVQRYQLPFQNFPEILQDGSYELRMPAGGGRQAYFQDSRDPVIQGVYKKLIEPYLRTTPMDGYEGFHHICECVKCGYITSVQTPTFAGNRLKCNVVAIPGAEYTLAYSVVMNKDSPYIALISKTLQNMKEGGIIKRIQSVNQPSPYIAAPKLTTPSVNMETVTMFFLVWIAGVVLSCTILLVENIFHKPMKIM